MITTSYDPEADALYVRLSPKGTAITETYEVEPGVMLDIDSAGRTVGIEILNVRSRDASQAVTA